VSLVKEAVSAAQMKDGPVMAAGDATTVCVRVTKQPLGIVHVMVVVPNATAVQIPLPVPIVATAVLLLVHSPALP
jgi:hypothetical protein